MFIKNFDIINAPIINIISMIKRNLSMLHEIWQHATTISFGIHIAIMIMEINLLNSEFNNFNNTDIITHDVDHRK